MTATTIAMSSIGRAPAPVLTVPAKTPSAVKVPKGFLPLLFYSAMFMLAPILYTYVEYTWTDTMTRASLIAVSAGYAVMVVLANDCVVWFNMVLFFHIGIEVKVLEILYDNAQLETTDTMDEMLFWSAFATIIVHLLPFLLIDKTMLLTLLASAGVIVNSTVLVFLDDSHLLLVGFSSVSLLGTTLCISGVCDVATSLMTNFYKAMKDGTWLKCSSYLM